MFRANKILEANKKKLERMQNTTSGFVTQHERMVTTLNDMELSTLDEIVHNEIIKRHIKKAITNLNI